MPYSCRLRDVGSRFPEPCKRQPPRKTVVLKTVKEWRRPMGVYKYIRNAWKKPEENLGQIYKNRLIKWRTEPVTVRADRPTRLDKARSLGYKAKQGILIIRQRVLRGGRMRPDIKGGRRSKHSRQNLVLAKNYQRVAEERAVEKYTNCEVLNSYEVGRDGLSFWYEVILIDRDHPQITSDPRYANIAKQHGRVYRGLTSAGKRSRGLLHKGLGSERARPSLRANDRQGN